MHRGALPTAESGINQHQRLQEKSGRDGVEQIVEENSVCLMLTHTHGPKCLNKAVGGGGGEGRDFGGTLVQNDSDVVHSGAARATRVSVRVLSLRDEGHAASALTQLRKPPPAF